jgi:hypothetical protein
MKRIALVLLLFWWAAGCTSKEARHDATVFGEGVVDTVAILSDPVGTLGLPTWSPGR